MHVGLVARARMCAGQTREATASRRIRMRTNSHMGSAGPMLRPPEQLGSVACDGRREREREARESERERKYRVETTEREREREIARVASNRAPDESASIESRDQK